MVKISKIVAGIRPASKMFRVPSVAGLAIDAILAVRGKEPLADEYYSQVATNLEQGTFRLQNEELGNTLRVDMINVVLTKDAYDSETELNPDEVIREFSAVWKALDGVLKVRDVRRIGLVAEHQFTPTKSHPSRRLMETLTTVEAPAHPSKFSLRYEAHRPTKEGLAPDVAKSDFVNVIYAFYDSEMDADHSNVGAINANLDVQRYYSPLLTTKIEAEFTHLQKMLLNEKKAFDKFLRTKELIE